MVRQYASAGTVVLTADPADPRVLLLEQTRATGERQTVAPKGRIEPGEGPLAAAWREAGEEAGLHHLAYAGYLGREGYTFADKDGTPATKTVDWFLAVTATTGTTVRTVEGFTTARWYPIADASAAVSHAGFRVYLQRAAVIAAWRASGAQPYSSTVDRAVRDIAAAAQPHLARHDHAGLAVCGSAARGDTVEGWSDIDLIAWGLPTTGTTAQTLTDLAHDTATRHAVRISLHHAGEHPDTGVPGHDLKLHAALRRIGTDTAVIAGNTPAATPPGLAQADVLNGQTGLHAYALGRLTQPVGTLDEVGVRRERARRTLSAACSAARLTALTRHRAAPARRGRHTPPAPPRHADHRTTAQLRHRPPAPHHRPRPRRTPRRPGTRRHRRPYRPRRSISPAIAPPC